MRRSIGLALCALAFGCAGVPEPQLAGLEIRVERGLTQPIVLDPNVPATLIVDLAASDTASAAGPSPRQAIRAATERFVRARPAAPSTALILLRERSGECAAPLEISAHAAPLAAQLASAREGETGGLAAALAAASAQIAAQPGAPGHRVVVFSDFAPRCAADPCSPARALLEQGATLDLVAFGGGEPPACLGSLAAPTRAPATAEVDPPTEPVGFRVEIPDEAAPGGFRELARGRVEGGTLVLPAGQVRVVLGLEPEARVGPIELGADVVTRVRLLDFPALDVRQLFVDTRPSRAGEPGGPPAAGPEAGE